MQYLTALGTGALEIGYPQVVPTGLIIDINIRIVYYAVLSACLFQKIKHTNPVGIVCG